jgi:hypothetical protein
LFSSIGGKGRSGDAVHSLSHIIFSRETYVAEGRKIASAASRNGGMAGPVKD